MDIGDKAAPARPGRERDRPPLNPERVAAVRAAVAAGTYRIDPAMIVARLLEVEGLLGRVLARD
jgi:anti-sigma28 factor (negative regulator of flagellin synthesis)